MAVHWRAGWRSATITSGELFVITHGVHLMPEWSVVSWVTLLQVSEITSWNIVVKFTMTEHSIFQIHARFMLEGESDSIIIMGVVATI